MVCEEAYAAGKVESGWRMLEVEGPLPFEMTGVLSSIAAPLAAAGVSIFVVSTFDTDYVLVKEAALAAGLDALQAAGFTWQPQESSS